MQPHKAWEGSLHHHRAPCGSFIWGFEAPLLSDDFLPAHGPLSHLVAVVRPSQDLFPNLLLPSRKTLSFNDSPSSLYLLKRILNALNNFSGIRSKSMNLEAGDFQRGTVFHPKYISV